MGLLVASRAKTMEAVSGLMNLVMLPMWILSGVFFSATRFPAVIQPGAGAAADRGDRCDAREYAARDGVGADDGAGRDIAGVVCGAVCGVAQNFSVEMIESRLVPLDLDVVGFQPGKMEPI